ncbi:hypothetical protein [Streptomonospora wellingtoniae]|uniref:Uncharacterized protein n=1 Tax=Streptomonospora wellingtoniae TaxID=3075544 RepID=A0ABU2KUJ2_9ACTN|nr:hypothetical protein [Streptomonospora sp. DSM 45055]MDT0302949.1 hypothetical protein [Streptomonospora sp. DSM 45055]
MSAPDCRHRDCAEPVQTRGYCESHYRKRLRMGLCGWRDAAPARAHIRRLRDLGWTWQQIGEAAGLSTWVPLRVATDGPGRHVRADTEKALLSVPPEPRGSHRGTDSAGTRRRVQALAWMGWPAAEVARRAGVNPRSLQALMQPSRRLSFDLAARVARAYEELCMAPGPSKVAAGKARQLGFLPPLAWDADLIDLPEDELSAELDRRVKAMGDAELGRCARARAEGDPSPLIVAGAREHKRRRYARERARSQSRMSAHERAA